MTLPVFFVYGVLNGLNGGRVSEILTPQNGDYSSDDRPRLVLDTNTVLALWMFRDPKLDALRVWIEAGKCRLYSREDALEELRRVLSYRRFGHTHTTQETFIEDYVRRISLLDRPPFTNGNTVIRELPICRDLDDQKFLEIAADAAATHLITRDNDLRRLARHRLVRKRFAIITPERFSTTTLSDAPLSP